MSARPRDIGTAARLCACGCGQRPQNWSATYIAGHRPLRPLSERLWARVLKQASGCWEWQGYRQPFGHGQIGRGGKGAGNVMAHRAAWEVTHGPVPDGMVVRHRCDNPPCCNPDHLEVGPQALNVADMVQRNRQARGVTLPQARFTDAQVATIRARVTAGELQRVVAADFGTSQGYVSALVTGTYRKEGA